MYRPDLKVCVALLGALLLCSCGDAAKKVPSHAVAITPPFKNIKVESQVFVIDPRRQQVLHLPKGGRLIVPAHAFTDGEGHVVTTPVTLTYKQMNSAADIIASGIPMVAADASGQVRQMQSAGMFDLQGTAAGKQVNIAQDKTLSLSMASTVKGDYDLFYLEQEQPQTAGAGLIPEAKAQAEEVPRTWWKQLTKDVADPQASYPALDSFQLRYDVAKYPENKVLESMRWKLSDGRYDPNRATHAWVRSEVWEEVNIVKTKNKALLLSETPRNYGLFPDSMALYAYEQGHVKIYDLEGKLIKDLGRTVVSQAHFYHHNSKFLMVEDSTALRLHDSRGKLIARIPGGSEGTVLSTDCVLYRKRDQPVYVIADLQGRTIKEIPVQPAINDDMRINRCGLVDKDALLVSDLNGGRIYNLAGDLLAQSPLILDNMFYDYWYWYGFAEHKYIPGYDRKGNHCVWDWKAQKTIPLKNQDRVYAMHPNKTQVLCQGFLKDNYHLYIYDWDKGNEKPLLDYTIPPMESYSHYVYYSPKGNFIIERDERKDKHVYTLYDSEGQVLWKYENLQKRWNHRPFDFTENEDMVLFLLSPNICLMDSKGKVIRNLSAVDTTLRYASLSENEVTSFSASNDVGIWDLKGKLLTSFRMGDDGYLYNHEDSTVCYCNEEGHVVVRDLVKNEITHTLGSKVGTYPHRYGDVLLLEPSERDHKNGSSLWKLTQEPTKDAEYQLCVRSKDKIFVTYVYLTAKDLEVLAQFHRMRKSALATEASRKDQEEVVLRSFEISKFGIYNWDVFYHTEKEMLELALELDGGQALTAHTQYTAFLVTGTDQNVVVKFTRPQLEAFKFWPQEPAQLLVVLPNDSVGFFDREDFAALDLVQLRQQKKATFKLKVFGGLDAKTKLEALLKKGAAPS